MGYYTRYMANVTRIDGREITNEEHWSIIKKLIEIDPWEFEGWDDYANDNSTINDVVSFDAIKWYDSDEDMIELSKSFPDFIFELGGYGEEEGDWWIAKYHNGKYKWKTAKLPEIGLDELE